jgi:RimJ/RimL family protein N-acetyltransferase
MPAPRESLMDYLFYQLITPGSHRAIGAPAGYDVRIWRPSLTSVPPSVLPAGTSWTWWAFHNGGVFANREFATVMVMHNGTLAHRLGVFPGFFRFPFMRKDDLQFGDLWTHDAHRGRGLAGVAIDAALASAARAGRRFWYITDPSNVASIRVAEKAGFQLIGHGTREPRAGVHGLGFYRLNADAPTAHPSTLPRRTTT